MSEQTAEVEPELEPDQVVILPTAEFLRLVGEHFEHTSYVGINMTRTLTYQSIGETDDPKAITTTLVAVGITPEDLKVLPDLMTAITGHPPMRLGAAVDDIETQKMMERELYEGRSVLTNPRPEVPTAIIDPGQGSIMQF